MKHTQARSASVELSGETDADLLEYMTLRDDDAAGAREAWAEFYRRHVRYLFAVCMRAYGPILGGEAGVCDLVADTLKRAYERAGTFDAAGLTGPDDVRRRVRAWLGAIAQRLALTTLRGRGQLRTQFLEQDHWQRVAEQRARPQPDEPRIERVRAAIEGLTDREQIVIRTTCQWYRPECAHQRLPNDVAADLARTLRTTPENLRQIRRRALQKIRTFLETRQVPEGERGV